MPMMALLTLISGCSTRSVAVQDDVCPSYPKIKTVSPEIKGQLKAFRRMSFVRDTSLNHSHATCRFNNKDFDNEMKNAIIIYQDDLFKLITDLGDMLSEVKQHNNRVEKYNESEKND